ncbi:TetR/AcrR family transcriptional regulator [Flavihumibacter profundi]|jgi:TetR/AcrR family transcriptional regulator, cholesterol catabolism regulator|uniref:TetR/AcrR family transcriptional regulator n=1 Tax=Flavihumibacter profundi TaxID=2716883 RepID=UPI001CC34FF8|nr:TetR/AcrR family transcriptional regulator [Flavihumibacter profundi]MBZ5858747.1 TetR/AcrR family transcriptional regulator [Flavihumibacter profundi]
MAKIKNKNNGTKKEVIVEAATRLFREKGFKAASMRDLAEAVGVEAASLYNHIQSKEELLQEICFKVANEFTQKVDEIENSDLTSIQKVEAMLRFHIRQMFHHYEMVIVADRDWKHLSDPYLSNFHSQRRVYRKRLAGIIEKGIAQKEIKPVDAPTVVLIMLHAVNGIESWHRSKEKISPKQLEENMVLIMIEGLKA